MADKDSTPLKYEKAARFIDGEKIDLDQTEQDLVEDYQTVEGGIRSQLDVEMSPEITRKLHKKIHLIVRNLPKRVLRAFIIGLIIAVAFALVLIAYRYFRMGSSVSASSESTRPGICSTMLACHREHGGINEVK